MLSAVKASLLITIFLTMTASLALAETDSITGASSQVVFAITIIVGIAIALILGYIANENRQAKRKIIISKAKPGEIDPNEIFQELQGLSGSPKHQKKAATSISNLLETKVEEKVTIVKKELTEKYGRLVEEKKPSCRRISTKI